LETNTILPFSPGNVAQAELLVNSRIKAANKRVVATDKLRENLDVCIIPPDLLS